MFIHPSLAFAPSNVLSAGKLRTDEEEVTNPNWECNETMSAALEKVAKED